MEITGKPTLKLEPRAGKTVTAKRKIPALDQN
jgi:hypothetical protein